MTFTTLITSHDAAKYIDDPNWAFLDCRFALAEPEKGWRDYQAAHVPDAVYVHLDRDLSGEIIPGQTGRHPLPEIEAAGRTFASLGIGSGVQVVTYDDTGGALAASRAWWILRWLGHTAVAVLDGGWQKWIAEGHPTLTGIENRNAREFVPQPRPELLVSAEQVDAIRQDPRYLLVDARAAERYRGEVEPIDKIAGHIPGAINAPFGENLTPQGVFLPINNLKTRYQDLLGAIPASRSAFYCGSGVTSIHNILAIHHAGLGEARLYAGSWSEWITDPRRAINQRE